VTLQHPKDRERLDGFGVPVLSEWADGSRVSATQEQLEILARLGFKPHSSSELGALIAANALDKAWLVESFDPFFQRVESATAITADRETSIDASILSSLSVEQLAAINAVEDVDSDSDGLTDTEEVWWCTNPAAFDSDGDTVSDGQEVAQLLAGNKTNGKPFLGWPVAIDFQGDLLDAQGPCSNFKKRMNFVLQPIPRQAWSLCGLGESRCVNAKIDVTTLQLI